ncbi:MAG: YifB family Mg chelatase-like AAA ATPase [Hahellaceae bacterium]|nr:YifB family Mg chelatase-like AAA ATPase [Hahellaceae bacterium]MCP5209665.1 YifB family Mg chelatase-like AAA ATPase [Hahellaceae bacterium]
MSLSIIYSRAQLGVIAPAVTVETHIANGLPCLSIVGLPEAAVKESKDRVRSALVNSGFSFPNRKITINLAPADLPKSGGRYDLAIAMGVLLATGQVPSAKITNIEFIGELALSGDIRPVSGVLSASAACAEAGHVLVLPAENAAEASLYEGVKLIPAKSLSELCHWLTMDESLPLFLPADRGRQVTITYPDFSEVRGQFQAKRALEIAAAGSHNILLFGPPGTGKSMLASRLPGILPPLTADEALEVATVHSVAGMTIRVDDWARRPFRSPHHTASAVALVGGGSHPKPGEISLAHRGVLFLDEFPEYDRKVIEVLREPLESREIVISRAAGRLTFPANFQLVAAMNPCPCGYAGHPTVACSDSVAQIERYQGKISGPMLDRFDIQVEVPPQEAKIFTRRPDAEESTEVIRSRVARARLAQMRRGKVNAELTPTDLQEVAEIDGQAMQFLEQAVSRLNLSARAIHRIMRVGRTIADLAGETAVSRNHIAEAIGYRKYDRSLKPL